MARLGSLTLIAALLVTGVGLGEAAAATLELRRYSGIPRGTSPLPARDLWYPDLPSLHVTDRPIPGGGGIGSCSSATPARCNPFSTRNTLFGRRDFVWIGDNRGSIFNTPRIDGFFGVDDLGSLLLEHGVNEELFGLLCSSTIGFSDPEIADRCDATRPAAGVPEPGAALVFGLGLAAVATRVRRQRA